MNFLFFSAFVMGGKKIDGAASGDKKAKKIGRRFWGRPSPAEYTGWPEVFQQRAAAVRIA
ncbi:hypothetical protein KDL45_06405 [bacterium]|nr:hypothetical protein [bacterium]